MKIINYKLSIMFISFLIVMTSNSCSNILKSTNSDKVVIRATFSGIRISNNTNNPINYIIVEKSTANLIDWGPFCDDELDIEPSTNKDILYSDITGYSKDCKVIVWWWSCDNDTVNYDMDTKTIQTY